MWQGYNGGISLFTVNQFIQLGMASIKIVFHSLELKANDIYDMENGYSQDIIKI